MLHTCTFSALSTSLKCSQCLLVFALSVQYVCMFKAELLLLALDEFEGLVEVLGLDQGREPCLTRPGLVLCPVNLEDYIHKGKRVRIEIIGEDIIC